MLFKSSTVVALVALASQVVAEPLPYKPNKVKSVRSMFGIAARDDGGYSPAESYCGMGDTCASACGDGYATCSSTDNAIHCYNAGANQICCPDDTGNSCDVGYYCSAASNGDTICCPEGQSLTECAASYGVTGSLISETPLPTSTSTSSTSSTSSVATTTAVNTTTTSFSSTIAPSTSTSTSTSASLTPSWSGNSTTILATGTGAASCSATSQYTYATSNNYTSALPSPTASTESSESSESETAPAAGSSTAVVTSEGTNRPVAIFAALVAAVFALML